MRFRDIRYGHVRIAVESACVAAYSLRSYVCPLFLTYSPTLQPLNEQLEKLPDNCFYNVDEDKLFSVSSACTVHIQFWTALDVDYALEGCV